MDREELHPGIDELLEELGQQLSLGQQQPVVNSVSPDRICIGCRWWVRVGNHYVEEAGEIT